MGAPRPRAMHSALLRRGTAARPRRPVHVPPNNLGFAADGPALVRLWPVV
jgi:hypothetical protein